MNPWIKRAAMVALPYAIRKFQQRQAAAPIKTSGHRTTTTSRTIQPRRGRRLR